MDSHTPSISQAEFEDLVAYAARLLRKFGGALKTGSMDPRDLVDTVYMKHMNAEDAVRAGHAEVRNRRLQLTPVAKLDPSVVARYQLGFRRWDPEKHAFSIFLRLAILSEIRDRAHERRSEQDSLSSLESSGDNPEELADVENAKRAFIEKIDDDVLKEIAERVLFAKSSITDLMLEFSLSRSQVEKRLRKLHALAERDSEP